MVLLSDHVQRVKYNHSYFGWGPVMGAFLPGSALRPHLFLIYMNDMFLKIQNIYSLLMTLVLSAVVMII